MKKLTIALLLSALLLPSCASKDRRILGTWSVAGGGSNIVTAKIDEKTMQIIEPDGAISFPYVIDYTKDPAWIDLNTEDDPSKGIVEFLGKDAFWILSNDGDEARASDLKSAEQILIFKRIETQKRTSGKYTPKKNSHLGAWIGASENGVRIKLTIVPQMIKIESDDETHVAEYSIDYAKKPIWFDLSDGEETQEAIIEFIDKNSFRFSEPQEERPESFAGLEGIVIFRRVND